MPHYTPSCHRSARPRLEAQEPWLLERSLTWGVPPPHPRPRVLYLRERGSAANALLAQPGR